jgi:L-threonylcarbamoyladenylate synthase
LIKRQNSLHTPTSAKLRSIDPLNPQPEIVKEAALSVSKGGVVCFPTRCLYGLGADALDPEAVKKVFQIKKRSFQKPILVLIKSKNDLHKLAKSVPPVAKSLMNRFWPGSVTIVFEAVDSLSTILTAGTGKIGVRLPGYPSACALVQALKNPMTGTSANISGSRGCTLIHDLDPFISDKLDLILDA